MQARVRSWFFGLAALLYLTGALGALGMFGGTFGSRVPGLFGAMFLALGFMLGSPPRERRDDKPLDDLFDLYERPPRKAKPGDGTG